MPVGPYETFDICVAAQQKRGHNKETAGKICGKIEQMQKKQLASVRETETSFRVRVRPPGDFQKGTFRIIDIDKSRGIKAVVGRPRGKVTTDTQVYIFPKDKFTKESALNWVKKRKLSNGQWDFKTFWIDAFAQFTEGKFDPDKEFEFISTAMQTDRRYGEFSYSKAELQQMADNFNNNVVGTKIPIDKNHDDDHIALAWLAEGTLRVAPSKLLKGEHSLFGKLKEYTPHGKELVETGALRYFSIQVEHLFEKMIGKIKKKFSNVIRAIALTNMPVVKDLSPTYSENFNLSLNSNIMDLKQFLLAANAVLLGEKVSVEQVAHLKTLAEDLPDEVKKEAGEKVAEAEKKAEEAPEETEEEKKAREAKEAEEAEKEGKEEKELAEKLKGKTTFSLAEVTEIATLTAEKAVKKALVPVSISLNEARTEQRERRLIESFGKMSLNEADETIVIKPAVKDKIMQFARKLSDDMQKEYFEVHKDCVAVVDLSEEAGHSEVLKKKGTVKPEEAAKKLNELAQKRFNEKKENKGYTLVEALREVRSENEELSEAAGQTVKY